MKKFSKSLLILASLAGFGLYSVAQAALVDQIKNVNGVCGADVQGQNYKGCTAGEISISKVSEVIFSAGAITECIEGTDLLIDSATVDYTMGTQSRSDLIMWIGDQEGTDPRLSSGPGKTCSSFSLPGPFLATPDASNPFGNRTGDDDQCGDLVVATPTAQRVFTSDPPYKFDCQDNDGDGKMDLQILLTWSQNVNQACGTGINQTFPTVGTVSKCDYQLTSTDINVVFPPILTLVKQVTNDNNGPGVASQWTLKADGPTTLEGISESPAVTAVDVLPGDYDLSEVWDGPGLSVYDGTWNCDKGSLSNDTVTLTNFAGTPGDPGIAARTVTCTVTNDDQPATLTLTKVVINDEDPKGTAEPKDWTLQAITQNPPLIALSGPGDGSATSNSMSAGVYQLGEIGGPGGYIPGSWSCDPSDGLSVNELTLLNGQIVSCEITNDDILSEENAPTLTLLKAVTNDDGGTAIPEYFTLTLQGIDGPHNSAQNYPHDSSPVVVADVEYTMSELPFIGYTMVGDPECKDSQGNPVVPLKMVAEQEVTCTISNNDIAPTLTLVKNVIGGGLKESVFALKLTGNDVTHASGKNYASGDSPVILGSVQYTVSEPTIPDGYGLTGIVCRNGSNQIIGNGGTFTPVVGDEITCTVTNNEIQEIAPTLTLLKAVTNDDGGTAEPKDFTLILQGDDGEHNTAKNYDHNSSPVVVAGVEYTMSELPFIGYTMVGDPECKDSQGNPVVPLKMVAEQEVTCTISNNDDVIFFEGIPSLNKYSLALLALLMLGIGVLGFRRFS